MIFILTEKKDAGCELASALPNNEFKGTLSALKNQAKQKYLESDNYLISWASGHLFEDAMPELINPEYKLGNRLETDEAYRMEDMLPGLKRIPSDDPHKKGQLLILKKLINRDDIDSIILAPDADAEGEAIARDILSLRKKLSGISIQRFWNTGSFKSEEAVKKSMDNLKDYNDPKYLALYHSQLARSGADQILGLKSTKCAVEYYNKKLFLGRVKSVCIGLVGNRENEINNFRPSNYYSINGKVGEIEFSHFYNPDDDAKSKSKERNYFNQELAFKVKTDLEQNNNEVKVLSFDTKLSTSKTRPLPLSGSDFASEMMGEYNISYDDANEILSYLRNEGFSSYQGSNGRVFSSLDAQDVKDALNTCNSYFGLNAEFTTDTYIFNDKKAAKQNHAPIHVLPKLPNESDLANWEKHKLPKIKEAYELIAKRIIVAFLEDDEIEKQHLVIRSTEHDHHFDLSGQRAIKQGWRSFIDKEIKDTTFQLSEPLTKGDIFNLDSVDIKSSLTKAPQLYTTKTLLDTLCNVSRVIDKLKQESVDPAQIEKFKKIKKLLNNAEGIGTDRTRASIIGQLIDLPAIEANKKDQLTLTELGLEQFHVYPPEMKSIILTASWENSFEEIRQGKLNYTEFLENIDQIVMGRIIPHIQNNVGVKVLPYIVKRDLIEGVICPLCESSIYETEKAYKCDNNSFKQGKQSGCKFSILKDANKTLGRLLEGQGDITLILETSKEKPLKESKHGIYLDIENTYFINVIWDSAISSTELIETKKTFKLGPKYVFKEFRGKQLTKLQAEKLLNGKTVKLNRVSKTNKKKYSVNVSYNEKDGNLNTEFV